MYLQDILRVLTPCNIFDLFRRFGGTYCLPASLTSRHRRQYVPPKRRGKPRKRRGVKDQNTTNDMLASQKGIYSMELVS
jgi:hypothetical protein